MKILIVEDDHALQTYLNDSMEAEGHEVKTAENGQVGLNIFEQFKPDLIISDIQMPVMDGLKMLEIIRHQHKDPIIIMVTAYGSEEFARKALHLGANNYLNKPIRHIELLPIIRKYNEVVENRLIENESFETAHQKLFTVEFDNDFEKLPTIVNQLIQEAKTLFEKDQYLEVKIGLMELLMNAVEHGNLGITYDEKSYALESETLYDLYEERQSDAVFSKRKVVVDYHQNETSCQWIISDEGNGFDLKTVPDPLDPNSNPLKFHGRGIFLSKFQFDEMEYNDKGNVVRVKKNISQN
ncbi:MAG: DNA-binding response OmpR family regulator [bacterium]|jgi:DNA-binding response OmpR family regulator